MRINVRRICVDKVQPLDQSCTCVPSTENIAHNVLSGTQSYPSTYQETRLPCMSRTLENGHLHLTRTKSSFPGTGFSSLTILTVDKSLSGSKKKHKTLGLSYSAIHRAIESYNFVGKRRTRFFSWQKCLCVIVETATMLDDCSRISSTRNYRVTQT